jgi:hypothetical protein
MCSRRDICEHLSLVLRACKPAFHDANGLPFELLTAGSTISWPQESIDHMARVMCYDAVRLTLTAEIAYRLVRC